MPQFNDKKIRHYLDLAKNASMNSDFPKHKIGAVFVYKNSVLAVGWNSCKTNPVQKMYNKNRKGFDVEANFSRANSLHAEVACLKKIQYLDIDFSKSVLFVYRQHRNGHKALARPCEACSAMIRDLGIKNIIYTTENGYATEYFD